MKKTFAWIGIVLFVMSCSTSEKKVFSESKTFQGNSWQRFKKINFRIPVEEPGQSYNFFFTFEYDSTYPYDHLPIHAILNTPAGEERIYTFDVNVRDSLGNEQGRSVIKSGNFQLRSNLWQGISVAKKGQIKLSVEQLIPKLNTPGIHQAGVEVTIAKD